MTPAVLERPSALLMTDFDPGRAVPRPWADAWDAMEEGARRFALRIAKLPGDLAGYAWDDLDLGEKAGILTGIKRMREWLGGLPA